MNLNRFRDPEETPAIPITALIDVLFLIIIFLVLGANFDQVETVRLPEAKGRPGEGSEPLRVELRADGRLWLDGQRLPDGEVLAVLTRKAPRAVLLLPDEQAPVGALIGWYDRIRRRLNGR